MPSTNTLQVEERIGWIYDSKESACNVGDPGLIPASRISSGKGNGNLLQYSCLENSMDRGAWLGYSLWGRKESDTTERLTTPLLLLKNKKTQETYQLQYNCNVLYSFRTWFKWIICWNYLWDNQENINIIIFNYKIKF